MVSVVLLVLYLQFSRANKLLNVSSTQYIAVERIQLEMTLANLYWEKGLSADKDPTPIVQKHLNLSAGYLDALLHGGSVKGVTIPQIESPDPQLRTQLLTLKHAIYQLRNEFSDALRLVNEPHLAAKMSLQLEQHLTDFFALVGALEVAIVQYHQTDSEYYLQVSEATLGLIVLFMIAYVAHIYRDQRQLASHISHVEKEHHRVSEHNQELNFMAFHDTLTNLPNRGHFEQELQFKVKQAARELQEFALIFIDIDNFKQVNDQLGHQVGDELLVSFSNQLRHELRGNDFVARLGGDEFVLIIASDSRLVNIELQAAMIASRVHELVSTPFSLASHQVTIGASLGVACYPKHTTNPQDLVKFADEAMYKAKVRGKNQVCYHQLATTLPDDEEHLLYFASSGQNDEPPHEPASSS